MTRVRHMALWLAAVIVLIAVGLMPSGAEAHAGHPPAAEAAATALPPAASAEIRRLLPQAALAQAVLRTAVALSASPNRGLSTGTLSTGACDGTCGNAGCRAPSCCCTGAGLAPAGDEAARPREPGDRALARALPARTDVVPEALPEPPRFDA